MRRLGVVVMAVGLLGLACGEDDPAREPPEGTDRKALCEAVCEPFVTCELMDPSGMEACVQLCVTDPSQTPERLETCGECLEKVVCDDIITGCADACTPSSLDLSVELSGAEGGELFAAVIDAHTGALLQTGYAPVENATALVQLPGSLPEGRATVVHAFLDADVDGACEDGERTWKVQLDATSQPLTLRLDPLAAEAPEACASFASIDRDLLVKASGLDLDGDPQAYVVLTGERFGRRMSDQRATSVSRGGFEVRYSRQLAPDVDWVAAYFVDVDGDGLCDPAVDAGGLRTIEAPLTGHVTVSIENDDMDTPSCDRFFGVGHDLLLTAGGLEAYAGAAVVGVLVHHETLEVRTTSAGLVQDGEVTMPFERELATGAPHRVSLFIDLDGDRNCTEADLSGWVEVPATAEDLVFDAGKLAPDASACEVQSSGL